jgi:hypothetical protein
MFALEMCFFSCWVCQIARAKAIRLVNIRIESVVTQDFSFFFSRLKKKSSSFFFYILHLVFPSLFKVEMGEMWEG